MTTAAFGVSKLESPASCRKKLACGSVGTQKIISVRQRRTTKSPTTLDGHLVLSVAHVVATGMMYPTVPAASKKTASPPVLVCCPSGIKGMTAQRFLILPATSCLSPNQEARSNAAQVLESVTPGKDIRYFIAEGVALTTPVVFPSCCSTEKHSEVDIVDDNDKHIGCIVGSADGGSREAENRPAEALDRLQPQEAVGFWVDITPVVSQTVQFPSGYSESVQAEHPSGQLKAEIA